MNTLGILREYFRQLWIIIFDYFGLVGLHLNLPLLRTRAMVNTSKRLPTCKHYKINEHSCNTSEVLSVAFD